MLHSGTGCGRLEAIASFLLSGSDSLFDEAAALLRREPTLVNTKFGVGQTLLHRAAGAWRLPLVQLLFELDADPNVLDAAGHAPLYYAGNSSNGGSDGSAKDADELVSLFTTKGANLDLTAGVKRCTPLHMAARRGNATLAVALVRGGASIEAHDSNGETPLRRAVNCGKPEVVRALLALGANPDTRCNRGRRPLDAARSDEIRALLAERSAA